MVGRRGLHPARRVQPRPDLRLRPASRVLAGKHEDHPLAHGLRDHRGDAEEILHGVAEAEAVALVAGIDEGAGARPFEGHESVVGAPDIRHVVEVGIGGPHLHRVQKAVPVRLQARQFARARCDGAKLAAHRLGPGGAADAEQHQHVGRRSRRQCQIALDDAAAVVREVLAVPTGAALDRLGPVKAPVDAEKLLPLAVIARDGAADLRHPPPARLVPVGEVARILGQTFARGGENETVAPHGVGDILGILEIKGVLQQAPLGGELAERKNAQPARPVAGVGDLQTPVLEVPIERDEVGRRGAHAAPLALDDRVAEAEAGGRFEFVERFADRLPRGRPVVAAVAVAQVKLPAGQVHRHGVVAMAQEAAGGGRAGEAVAAGLVGDDGAIPARAEIVGPGSRGVRASDDVFAGCVVEVTELHGRGVGGGTRGAQDGAAKKGQTKAAPPAWGEATPSVGGPLSGD